MTVEFEIEGQKFLVLNGGPIFKFNEAISFQGVLRDARRSGLLLGKTLRRWR